MRKSLAAVLAGALIVAAAAPAVSTVASSPVKPANGPCSPDQKTTCVATFNAGASWLYVAYDKITALQREGKLQSLEVEKGDKPGYLLLAGNPKDVNEAYHKLTQWKPVGKPWDPLCSGPSGNYCVLSYNVGSSLVNGTARLFASMQRHGAFKGLTVKKNYKDGSLTLLGDKAEVTSAYTLLENLGKSATGFGASKPAKQLALCEINDISPSASTSLLNAIVAFLDGKNTVPTPPPSPAPTSSGSPAPAPVPPPALSAKNGSVLLDSQQRRIIVHLPSESIAPLGQVLAMFSNVGPTVYRYYDLRYVIPNPIPEPSIAAVTGEISSAPSVIIPHTNVDDLVQSVTNIMNGTGSGVSVQADASYPRILVAGPASGVNEALRLLDSLDKKPAEILLTLNVLEYDTVKARDLGIQIPSTTPISASVGQYFSPTAAGPATPAPILHGKIVGLSAPIVPFNFNTLMNDGVLKLQSSPQVQTLNGRLAVIDVGQIIPFTANIINAQGVVVPGIVNYTIGTHLEVTPFINYDGSISVYVHPINSTLTGFTVQNAPQIDRRELSANFRLSEDQAVFLTGLVEDDTSDVRDQIPGLSLIPWLGKHLFGNRNSTDSYTHLMIEITASIIDLGELTYQTVPAGFATTPPLATPSPIPARPLTLKCAPSANTTNEAQSGGAQPTGPTAPVQPIGVTVTPSPTPVKTHAPPATFIMPPVGPGAK